MSRFAVVTDTLSMVRRSFGALVVLTFFLQPLTASARCGINRPPSYDDIQAVSFKRSGCGTFPAKTPHALRCSHYWVLFWKDEATEYNQFDLPGSVGKFTLATPFRKAVDLLRSHKFFGLAPDDYQMTDMASSRLEIYRCSTGTALIVLNVKQASPEAFALFAQFDDLIDKARRHRDSARPDRFMPYIHFSDY